MTKIFIKVILFLSLTSSLKGQDIAPFEDGDRVVFSGNSITDGGRYHSFIQLYYMTRFPDKKITIINGGIGGNRIIDMYKRLDTDILSKNPNKIVLIFGMNDSGYAEYNRADADAFANKIVAETFDNYKLIEKRLQELSHIDIILLGSSPYDEAVVKNSPLPFPVKNNTMRRIVKFQQKSAEDNGWDFFDFNEPMTDLNLKFQQKDPSFSLCGPDRIHPDNDGHMVMAYLFLKAQGFEGKDVAKVEIDVKNKNVLTSENCLITNDTYSNNRITFEYLANALPYPLDTVPLAGEYKMRQSDAMSIVPFMQEMNNEELRIKGLDDGIYTISIDDVIIGSRTNRQLEKGINLAEISWTPQYQQALTIMYLNEKRWRLERELRDYIWIQYYFFEKRGLLFSDNKEALDMLDKEIPNDIWLTGRREQYALLRHPEIRETYRKQIDLLTSTIYKLNTPKVRQMQIEKNNPIIQK